MVLSQGLLISLAFTTIIAILLFFYIRQRTNSVEQKINTLIQFVQNEASKVQPIRGAGSAIEPNMNVYPSTLNSENTDQTNNIIDVSDDDSDDSDDSDASDASDASDDSDLSDGDTTIELNTNDTNIIELDVVNFETPLTDADNTTRIISMLPESTFTLNNSVDSDSNVDSNEIDS